MASKIVIPPRVGAEEGVEGGVWESPFCNCRDQRTRITIFCSFTAQIFQIGDFPAWGGVGVEDDVLVPLF